MGEPGGDLLSHTVSALSSARLRFTVLFEMGRGGSKVLWPPSVTCRHGALMITTRRAQNRRMMVLVVTALSTELLLKVIGSSLTGN